jgi:hypothetical protein
LLNTIAVIKAQIEANRTQCEIIFIVLQKLRYIFLDKISRY